VKRDVAAVEVFLSLEGRDVRVGRLTREPRRGFEAVGFTLHRHVARAPGSLRPPARTRAGARDLRTAGGAGGLRRDRRLGARYVGPHAAAAGRAARRTAGGAPRPNPAGVRLPPRRGGRGAVRRPAVSMGGRRALRGACARRGAQHRARSPAARRQRSDAEDGRVGGGPAAPLGPRLVVGWRAPQGVGRRGRRCAVDRQVPEGDDEYPLERWEAVALRLAERSGIAAASARVLEVDGRIALIVRRFDRAGERRVPYLSAMAMLDRADGERASYLEIADAIARYGARPMPIGASSIRRLAFNVLVSNVDDHLRNHGFLWSGREGWRLSPAFDLNPTPVDVRERTLTTAIDLEDGTCDLALVLEVAPVLRTGGARGADVDPQRRRRRRRMADRGPRRWAPVERRSSGWPAPSSTTMRVQRRGSESRRAARWLGRAQVAMPPLSSSCPPSRLRLWRSQRGLG
jgi:serine/threonine-protein kinase HipA